MKRYKAEVVIRTYVEFEDNGETELVDLAYEQALMAFGHDDDIEVGKIEEVLK